MFLDGLSRPWAQKSWGNIYSWIFETEGQAGINFPPCLSNSHCLPDLLSHAPFTHSNCTTLAAFLSSNMPATFQPVVLPKMQILPETCDRSKNSMNWKDLYSWGETNLFKCILLYSIWHWVIILIQFHELTEEERRRREGESSWERLEGAKGWGPLVHTVQMQNF